MVRADENTVVILDTGTALIQADSGTNDEPALQWQGACSGVASNPP
jgi:hypothetical protein